MTTPEVSHTTHGSDSIFAEGASLNNVAERHDQSYQNKESSVPSEKLKKTPISQKVIVKESTSIQY